MDQTAIAAVVDEVRLAIETDRPAIRRICQLTAPETVTPDELRAAASAIVITFRSTRAWDDDCYWCGRSPFDHKWYVFAQDFGTPAFVEDAYPSMMDE
jgi:hypothetical protein